MQANALAKSFLKKEADFETLMREWPVPSQNTARVNIPARLLNLVPSDIVELANEINSQLFIQKTVISISDPSYARTAEDGVRYLNELFDQMNNIKKLVDILRDKLEAEYLATFK